MGLTTAPTLPAVREELQAAFAAARVQGFLHAREIGYNAEVGHNADLPVVLASVFKIPIALALAQQFADGTLDPAERVRVSPHQHTLGSTGLSALRDEVEMSLRDLGLQMITVSDNTATDVILARVGRAAVTAMLARLGLDQTVIELDCKELLGRLVDDLRLSAAERPQLAADEDAALAAIAPDRWAACADLQAATTNHSTPREITALLEAIWTDRAASAPACAFVRGVMGQQVWPHRLRSGFPGGVTVSGKTGTLPFIRNEAGVVEYGDGRRFAVAVFTLAAEPSLQDPDADRVIGTAARIAVDHLRAGAAA